MIIYCQFTYLVHNVKILNLNLMLLYLKAANIYLVKISNICSRFRFTECQQASIWHSRHTADVDLPGPGDCRSGWVVL